MCVCVCVCATLYVQSRGITTFTLNKAAFCYMLLISYDTGDKLIISLYRINRLVYVIEAYRVFCEVGSECLEVAVSK